MTNATTTKAYGQRFDRVFDYIDAHLNEDLPVEQLSRVVNFSEYHFLGNAIPSLVVFARRSAIMTF